MNVRGKVVQPHDLSHTCRRDLAEVSQLGLIDDRSAVSPLPKASLR
jgi:hypothetical protein